MKANNIAVVVLSGGQDSVTCLGLALAKHTNVRAVAFDYGQRHGVELRCAAEVCDDYAVPLRVVDISFLKGLVTSSLTGAGDVSANHPKKPGLPASFVPARNALFLTLAHAYAAEHGAAVLYTGVCQTDYSGYPDCRDEFITALEKALNIGYQTDIVIRTPMMFLTKAETFYLAQKLGFLQTVIEGSHTCYNGSRMTLNPWGYGCGECPACKLRAKGFAEYSDGNFNPTLVDTLFS